MANSYEGITILGSPRSGTTLLRRILDSHPNLTCPPETHLFSACARFIEQEKSIEGLDIGVLTGLHYAGFEKSDVLSRLKDFVFQFHRDHANKVKKKRWIEKTAFDIFHLDAIEKIFNDDLQYIFIVRHGMDVICSLDEFYQKTGRPLGKLKNYLHRYPNRLEAFAQAWIETGLAIDSFIKAHPDNSILIKYEDLIDAPEEETRRILGFLNEDWCDNLIENAMQNQNELGLGDWKTYAKENIGKESINRWKSLSQVATNELGELINPTLKLFGYEPISSSATPSEEDAARRYQIGLMANTKKKKD